MKFTTFYSYNFEKEIHVKTIKMNWKIETFLDQLLRCNTLIYLKFKFIIHVDNRNSPKCKIKLCKCFVEK